jgi:REP element-mobilizing transposase RayT
MPQSLAKIVVHVVFGTKNGEGFLEEDVRKGCFAYIAGALKNLGCVPIIVGGTEDHVHVLCLLSKNVAACKVVEQIKTGSSKWMKTQSEKFAGFQWQNGYGVFSVSQSAVETVTAYIASQREHHRKVSFQEEFRRFLERYEIEYDERFVWD